MDKFFRCGGLNYVLSLCFMLITLSLTFGMDKTNKDIVNIVFYSYLSIINFIAGVGFTVLNEINRK